METEPWILVLGTADWNQSIATNQHYMARELCVDYRVTFVESLGLRRPEISRRDLGRVWQRLARSRPAVSAPGRAVPDGMSVWSPVLVPVHTGPVRRLNERLLHRLVRTWLEHSGPKVLWTYSPETYGLENLADAVVYHCVDLLAEVPGIPATVVDLGEKRLAAAGATAAGSSAVVVDHLRAQGFADALSWPNVADVDEIARAGVGVERDPEVRRAVFAGNLSTTKVDFSLLERIAGSGVELHLAGPIAEGGGQAASEVERVERAGAVYHGMLALPDLARLYWTADVGLIPYLVNPYTRGVNPLKTFEYLAAGLGVVATPVPAVQAVDGDVVVSGTNDEFVDAVVRLASQPSSDVVARRTALAEEHSWRRRGAQARAVVHEAVADLGASS